MANHTATATTSTPLTPLLRRAGLLFFGSLSLGAALRFFDGGSQQATQLLWMAVSSGIGGVLWAGIAAERRNGS